MSKAKYDKDARLGRVFSFILDLGKESNSLSKATEKYDGKKIRKSVIRIEKLILSYNKKGGKK